jgi:hypothetical protein
MRDLKAEPVLALLALRAAVDEELRRRGATRSLRDPLGDWAETLVARAVCGTLAKEGAGHDVVGPDGTKYQVKARRRPRYIDLPSWDFDVLVVIVFDGARVASAVAVPVATARAAARPSKKRDARGEFFMWVPAAALAGGEDWTARLREVEEAP